MNHASPSPTKSHSADAGASRWRQRTRGLLASAICAGVAGAMLAGPAAAEDCFPKIRAAEARQAMPRPAAPVRHRVHAVPARPLKAAQRIPRPKRIAVPARPASHTQKFVESSFHQQTLPIAWVRPAGCDKHPASAIQSAPPVDETPPSELLLAELAGPPPVQTDTSSEEVGPSFGGGGGPGYPPVSGGGGGGGGGRPPMTPPDGEPPPVEPPGGQPPPSLPPEVPPTWPPLGPPGGPPAFPPPEGPPGPPGPPIGPPGFPPPPPEFPPPPPQQPPLTPVPEPATWVMLIGGFFLIGQSVRSRRARAVTQ